MAASSVGFYLTIRCFAIPRHQHLYLYATLCLSLLAELFINTIRMKYIYLYEINWKNLNQAILSSDYVLFFSLSFLCKGAFIISDCMGCDRRKICERHIGYIGREMVVS